MNIYDACTVEVTEKNFYACAINTVQIRRQTKSDSFRGDSTSQCDSQSNAIEIRDVEKLNFNIILMIKFVKKNKRIKYAEALFTKNRQ